MSETANFDAWAAHATLLTARQRALLLEMIQPATAVDRISAMIDRIRPALTDCAHCCSSGCYRHGHDRGLQRYHRRFRQWLARFDGVASRYLPNYLG